jgi:hypothetical protein
MFARAISSTNVTTPASTLDVVRSSAPVTASRSGSIVTSQFLLVSGASFEIRAAIDAISARTPLRASSGAGEDGPARRQPSSR